MGTFERVSLDIMEVNGGDGEEEGSGCAVLGLKDRQAQLQ